MQMRSLAIVVVLMSLALAGCGEEPRPAPPVVLITVDGLGAEELSVFGGPVATPALQKIADGGGAWADGWTACPMTRPAAATYLTGLAPDRHGVRDDLFARLPEDVPTLADLLRERGYRTAAFPDSGFLGRGSGLLDGFELSDDPAGIARTPGRWLPAGRPAAQIASTAKSWIAGLPPAEPYFAWVHLSAPLLGHLDERLQPRKVEPRGAAGDDAAEAPKRFGLRKGYDDALKELDRAVGELLAAVGERGELERALVVLAATQGDPGGDREEPFGIGYSLHERAIRVPVIAGFPAGTAAVRGAESPVWAPDVPRTIAELTGVALSAEAEGTSLLEEPRDDRVIFSWSWALLDQMGWRELRAARAGGVKRTEGYLDKTARTDGGDEPVGQEDEQRLARAISERRRPAAPAVPLAEVEPLLRARGLSLEPVAAEGRDPATIDEAHRVAWLAWLARYKYRAGRGQRAGTDWTTAQNLDPKNLSALLDFGQMMTVNGRPAAVEVLERAARYYPTNREVLHWLAHAVWIESWEEAEPLLEAILSLSEHDPDVLYDLACARSLGGDLPAAEDFLRRSIEAGFREWNLIENDPDLRHLKQSGRLSEVLGEYR